MSALGLSALTRRCTVASLTSWLYRLARFSADVNALASGNPERIARRGRNKLMGRAMARGGAWRALWGGGGRRKRKEPPL